MCRIALLRARQERSRLSCAAVTTDASPHEGGPPTGGPVTRSAGMGGPSGRVVLVVGRDRAARGALAVALARGLGAQALSMSDGDGALVWARTLRPALVVDARPPHRAAADLVARLRGEPVTAGSRILGLGDPAAGELRRCDEVLADAGPAAVVQAVRRWLVAPARTAPLARRARPGA